MPADVLGEPVVRIMDPRPFLDVLQRPKGRSVNENLSLPSTVNMQNRALFCNEYHLLICLIRDITEEENERRRKEEISGQTAEIADRVVDKQMRIVQEIASLLGETAAETKIALTKLKESIRDE